MKKLLFISMLLLSTLATFAQKVVLCEDYDKTTGEPSGVYKNWDIKASGSYIYIIYTHNKQIKNELVVYIDKKYSDGEYGAFDTQYISTSETKGKNWAMLDFKFTEAGEYKIIILENGKELAYTYTTIGYQEGYEPTSNNNSNSNNNNDDDEIDTYYYENSEVSVATSVDDKTFEVSGKKESEYLSNIRGKELYIVVEQDSEFKTDLFYLDIELNGEFLETKEIEVESNWNIAWHKYSFTKRGKYYIEVYNANDVYVNSIEFEVK